LPAALVLAAASLAASRAHADADPLRPFAQAHVDVYLLHFSGAALGSVPINTSVGPLKGSDIGVTGAQTVGTSFVFPILGVGVEIPHALFYFHGGYTHFGRATGEVSTSGDVVLAFAQFTAAPRLSLGSFVLSLGPSVGIRYLHGWQAGGWDTGVQPALGGELDARVRMALRGKHSSRPTSSADLFIHFTGTAFEGASGMVALGVGGGSAPGR
jgi:hypothetical protein